MPVCLSTPHCTHRQRHRLGVLRSPFIVLTIVFPKLTRWMLDLQLVLKTLFKKCILEGRREKASLEGELTSKLGISQIPQVSEHIRLEDVAPWKRSTVSVPLWCRGTVLPHFALERLLLWSLTTAEFWKVVTVTWPRASDSSLACPRCYMGCSIPFLRAVSTEEN